MIYLQAKLATWVAEAVLKIFGQQLKSDADKELERLKSELHREAESILNRQRVEYGSLYPKRVSTIEELYAIMLSIQEFLNSIGELLHHYEEDNYINESDLKKAVDGVIDNLNKFTSILTSNVIYFSEESMCIISQYTLILKQFEADYAFYQDVHDEDIYGFANGAYTKMMEDRGYVHKKTETQNEFRKLIGIS